MRELLEVWRNTRMIVQVAVTAALYAAVLIPFKAVAILIPGVTEVRPANAVPIVCALLFGPAAAWGSAFGNLIGDVFGGMLGPGSLFGMVGNFLLAYVPYRMWRVLRGDRPADGSVRGLALFVICVIMGSLSCAVVIGYGVGALRLPIPMPYFVLALIIAGNNALLGSVLGAPLLALLYPRAKKWSLIYSDVMDMAEYRAGFVGWPGLVITSVAALAGVLLAADYLPTATTELASPYVQVLPAGVSLVYALGICSVLILLGATLMSPLGRSFGLVAEREADATERDEQPDQEGEE